MDSVDLLQMQSSGDCSSKSYYMYYRPAKSPDLGRRLPAFSMHCRLSGFGVYFTGEIENLVAFFFKIAYFIIYGNQTLIIIFALKYQ